MGVVEPLLPRREPHPEGGRPPIDDRKALAGILFVLKTGIPWEVLPQEMGYGSSMACWRRLCDWRADDVWERLRARPIKATDRGPRSPILWCVPSEEAKRPARILRIGEAGESVSPADGRPWYSLERPPDGGQSSRRAATAPADSPQPDCCNADGLSSGPAPFASTFRLPVLGSTYSTIQGPCPFAAFRRKLFVA